MAVVVDYLRLPDSSSSRAAVGDLATQGDEVVQFLGCAGGVHARPIPSARDVRRSDCLIEEGVDLLRFRAVKRPIPSDLKKEQAVLEQFAPAIVSQVPSGQVMCPRLLEVFGDKLAKVLRNARSVLALIY